MLFAVLCCMPGLLQAQDALNVIINIDDTTDRKVMIMPMGENGKVTEYSAAPYIVIGSGQLQKLEASTASGDISADLRQLAGTVAEIEEAYKEADGELDGRIDVIEETIGNGEGGLIKDIADLQQADIELDAKFNNYYDIRSTIII